MKFIWEFDNGTKHHSIGQEDVKDIIDLTPEETWDEIRRVCRDEINSQIICHKRTIKIKKFINVVLLFMLFATLFPPTEYQLMPNTKDVRSYASYYAVKNHYHTYEFIFLSRETHNKNMYWEKSILGKQLALNYILITLFVYFVFTYVGGIGRKLIEFVQYIFYKEPPDK